MRRTVLMIAMLTTLFAMALGSLVYAVKKARTDSADLERRAEEVSLFLQRKDPYRDPDMTYPPTALPVFAASVPTGSVAIRRSLWIGLNIVALLALCATMVRTWGQSWPPWTRAAFCLTVAASKPVRAGIALGQFHLIPTALIVGAEAAASAGRPIASGLMVGLAMTKPTMAAPYLFVIVARRQWRTLGTAIAVQAMLLIGVAAWLGIGPVSLIREWLETARSQITMGTIDVPTIGRDVFSSLGLSASAVSVVLLGVTAVVIVGLRRKSSLGLTSLALFFAAVITYHRHYDMVLLIPTLAYLIDSGYGLGPVAPTGPKMMRSVEDGIPTGYRGNEGRRKTGWMAIGFGILLILPSQILGSYEGIYDRGFVVLSYAILAALLMSVATEPARNTNDPEPAR